MTWGRRMLHPARYTRGTVEDAHIASLSRTQTIRIGRHPPPRIGAGSCQRHPSGKSAVGSAAMVDALVNLVLRDCPPILVGHALMATSRFLRRSHTAAKVEATS